METEQVKQLQQAIGKAAWNLNLDRFAAALDWNPEHDHTREKFKEFQLAAKALGRFDSETLTKIINAA